MFKGSMVALVTPMNSDGSVDMTSLHDLVEWHIAEKTDALVIAGTTGEGCTLTTQEQFDIIAAVVKQTKKRLPVIAGTGSNATQHTLELTLNAKKAGADAALIVTPYYNKPTQNGLVEHYKYVAEKSAFPIILYNVPSRTACDMLPETVIKVASLPNIIGIKEASGKVERAADILPHCPKTFVMYSGDDETAYALMRAGAQGVITVVGNIAPRKMHDLCEAAVTGNHTIADQLNNQLIPLYKKLFIESNPIPIKWALQQMGRIPAGIRLPLLPLDAKFHTTVKEALLESGIILEKSLT